ncbi:hypothetical protein [Arthrobacter sp.]|uniref:hypothetical protein n=1 Tax=Arthrobacter sp. TaxID=1667 RepID=UPI002811251A|nr:hypothetical protein [Arthrobacter sp.]
MTTAPVDQTPQIKVQLSHPERFWFAASSEMPWLVDPDVEDGKQRHDARNSIRWNVIGEIVHELGLQLLLKNYRAVEDEGGTRLRAIGS